MRGKLTAPLAMAAVFMALTGTAHAGYAYSDSSGEEPIFYAGPGEAPDLRFQVAADLDSVVFEDLRNPINVGPPPVDEHDLRDGDRTYPEAAVPCESISTHKARCSAQPGGTLWRIMIEAGELGATVRDLAGGQRAIDVFSGPLRDDIAIEHQTAVFVEDAGGPNLIRVGDGSGWMTDYDNIVEVGPGASEIDLRNGSRDRISCLQVAGIANLGSVLTNPLDRLVADADDVVQGCGNAES
jgi:hypothetical protein